MLRHATESQGVDAVCVCPDRQHHTETTKPWHDCEGAHLRDGQGHVLAALEGRVAGAFLFIAVGHLILPSDISIDTGWLIACIGLAVGVA